MKNKVQSPIISVVMATFNGEEFIAEAIQSILNQTYSDFEFIIVDDGSTDSTAMIVNSFKDRRIRYIKKDLNSGIADSLNQGVARAKGTYIARMDDDDVALPERFEQQLKAFDRDPELELCATNVIVDQKKKIKTKSFSHQEIKMKLLFANAITHPTVMMKRKLLLEHPYSPEMVPCEDYDLWSKLIWEHKCFVLGKPLVYYRTNANGETARRRKEQLVIAESISSYMFECLKWTGIRYHERSLKIMATHDYTINSGELNKLMMWFDSILEKNNLVKEFDDKNFKLEVDLQRHKFLESYFSNRSNRKKIIPFIFLKFPHKLWILKYYLETYLK